MYRILILGCKIVVLTMIFLVGFLSLLASYIGLSYLRISDLKIQEL